MPLGCIIWDPEFAVQEWNESAERILGWPHSEVLHRRYADFLAPAEDREAMEDLWKRLQRGKTVSHRQCENLTKYRGRIECDWFHTSLVDESGDVVAVASMVQDVTERKSLERQLLQSQKMEAIGTLAGGIAHDFNNLLTTIIGHLSLALMKLGPDHPATAGLGNAETAAERAADLIQQMLRFSRTPESSLTPVDANRCIEQVVRLLAHSIDPQIEVQAAASPDLWRVEADAGQIEQVLMNLIVNARDAITGKGVIRIESANRVEKPGLAGAGPKGEFVEISIADSGCGMDQATQSRVFEPFFTTKEVGKGTGLGLAMVYAIVKNHRGRVEVASKPGEGTVFRILLPRTEAAVESHVPHRLPAARAGVETVLVADDEESVRALARHILKAQGYPVIEARDGQEAVEAVELHRGQVGLVVLDLTMPRKSGWEAFEEIHAIDPGLPVIMSSGYSLKGGAQEAQQRGVHAFLSKPYKANELLNVVQEVLDGKYSFDRRS
jgi:PAS domain S-box-containing protein